MKSTPGKAPPFNSISRLRTLVNPRNGRQEYLYKIFSPAELDREFVQSILDIPSDSETLNDDDVITWQYHKLWQSYPVELPRVTFDDLFIAVDDDEEGAHNDTGRSKGIWYTSSIEPFISTMETSALMGRNIARLIVDDWSHDIASGVEARMKGQGSNTMVLSNDEL